LTTPLSSQTCKGNKNKKEIKSKNKRKKKTTLDYKFQKDGRDGSISLFLKILGIGRGGGE